MVAVKPVRHEIELFPQQDKFLWDGSRYVAAATGIGGGKSFVGAAKALKFVALHPKSMGVITAPSYVILRDATLRTVMSIWPKELTRGFHPSTMSITLPNGSEVAFRTTDDPEMLRGPNLNWAWMDEAAGSSEKAFEVLLGRVRVGDDRQMWLTTTPRGYNWFYERFAKNRREGYALHRWSARDNPYLPEGFIKDLEASYSKEFALQEIDGEFTVVGGNAYFKLEPLKEMLDACTVGQPSSGGLRTRWRGPMVGNHYVMGIDTAWGKTGSYSCAIVLDRRTGAQVAELHGRPDLDELAQLLYDMHVEYNRAYLMPEWAGDEDEGQYVVKKLVELGAGPWMYYRDPDKRQQPGFVTSGTTRPYILALLEVAVRKKAIVPQCRDWVLEMMSFVRDEKGRPAAAEGMQDDHVLAGALALRALDEAPMLDNEVVKVTHTWRKKDERSEYAR